MHDHALDRCDYNGPLWNHDSFVDFQVCYFLWLDIRDENERSLFRILHLHRDQMSVYTRRLRARFVMQLSFQVTICKQHARIMCHEKAITLLVDRLKISTNSGIGAIHCPGLPSYHTSLAHSHQSSFPE